MLFLIITLYRTILLIYLKIRIIMFTRYIYKIYILYIYNTYEYRFKKKKKKKYLKIY